MSRMVRIVAQVAAVLVVAQNVASAQISYVTVRTPRNPVPPMSLLPSDPPQTPQTTATALPASSLPAPARVATVRPALPPMTAAEKAEIDKRVLTFQKLRAEQGFASAQYTLGLRYLNGDGVVKDLTTARLWLGRSAEAGNTEARWKLTQLNTVAK